MNGIEKGENKENEEEWGSLQTNAKETAQRNEEAEQATHKPRRRKHSKDNKYEGKITNGNPTRLSSTHDLGKSSF